MFGTNISSNHSTLHPIHTVDAEGWAYIYDGYTSLRAWDGVAANAPLAGLPAGTNAFASVTANTGSFSSGTHFLRWRYSNSRTGYPGPAGAQTSFIATEDRTVDVYGMVECTDSKCNEIILEMTEAGGTTFYRAAYISNKDYSSLGVAHTLSIGDNSLSVQTLDYPDVSHTSPFIGRVMAYHKGYMFLGTGAEHSEGKITVPTAGSSNVVGFTGTADPVNFRSMQYLIEFPNHPTVYKIETTSPFLNTLNTDIPVDAAFSNTNYLLRPQYPNRIYISEALYPESFDALNFLNVLRDKGDTVQALLSHYQALLIFGAHELEMLVFDVDPLDVSDVRLVTVPGQRGAISQECVVEYGSDVYAMDYNGIYRFRGGRVEPIDNALTSLLQSIRWDKASTFHGHANKVEKSIVFFVCTGEDDIPKTSLVFDTETQQMSIHQYDADIQASASVLDGYGQYRPFLGLRNGMLRYGAVGTGDSESRVISSDQLTVASNASTTSIPIEQDNTIPTTIPQVPASQKQGYSYKGCSVYWEEGNEGRGITSLRIGTYNDLNVTPAFSSAPTAGDKLTVNRIWMLYQTKVFKRLPSMRDKTAYLALKFDKLFTESFMYVRVFRDGKTVPYDRWQASTEVTGVTFTQNDPFIKVDLRTEGGVVRIPLDLFWHESIQFEFSVRRTNTPLRLYKYELITDSMDSTNGY